MGKIPDGIFGGFTPLVRDCIAFFPVFPYFVFVLTPK